MKLTVTTLAGDFFNLDVSPDMEIENLNALCEFESKIPSAEIMLLWNGQPLQDKKKKIQDYGVKEGDVLLLQKLQQQNRPQQQTNTVPPALQGLDFGQIQIPGAPSQSQASAQRPTQQQSGLPNDPAQLRDMLLASPADLNVLKERNPPLAEALLSGSLEKFTEVLQKQQKERADREAEQIRLFNADPFDMDAQQKIAEQIRLKNVETNMEAAMEFAPESFGQVVMLYIDCKVNGHPVKAFVDSGAQMTIMSQACAERCGIMRLVDRRWAGIAKGVGTQKIIGRVHLCQIQIENDYLQTAFSILEEQPMDMLLGLDMLKRHQCILDLNEHCLTIGTTKTKTRFLPEGELPAHARLNRTLSADEDKQLAEAMNKSAQQAAGEAAVSRSQAGTSGSSTGASASASSPFPEKDISTITTNGFSRQQAIEELTKSGGNVDQAIAALFAKSFAMP